MNDNCNARIALQPARGWLKGGGCREGLHAAWRYPRRFAGLVAKGMVNPPHAAMPTGHGRTGAARASVSLRGSDVSASQLTPAWA
jgi:hypothetical protein